MLTENKTIMEAITLQAKDLLPGVVLDRESGIFEISGISCPMNAFDFYDPIFEWIDEYIKDPLDKTVLDLNLTYFNTVSAKFLLRIMNKFDDLYESGNEVKIRWYYEEGDYDMMEEGEEFSDIVNVDFELIASSTVGKNSEDDEFFEDILSEL